MQLLVVACVVFGLCLNSINPGYGQDANSTTTTSSSPVETSELTNNNAEDVNNREAKVLRLDNELLAKRPCNCDEPQLPLDLASCVGRRATQDPRCPCRQTCNRQAGQTCSDGVPCDAEFGLECHPDTQVCQGKLRVQTSEVTHSSVTLRWRSTKFEEIPQASVMYSPTFSGKDTQWTNVLEVDESLSKVDNLLPNTEYFFKVEESGDYEILAVKTKDGCRLNETTSYGLGETFHSGCEQTCTCLENGKTECRARCNFRPGAVTAPSCVEVPHDSDPCCVIYKCQDNNAPPLTPKVLVTQRTPSSFTLAWDDFKLPNYESGYVVEYRPTDSGEGREWDQVQTGNTPLMTISKLKPHTAYQIRILVWEDIAAKKVGTTSEMVTVFTEDGCIHNNQTLTVGQEYDIGCNKTCACKGNNEEECRDICTTPFFNIGSFKDDPLCDEVPTDGHPCCVMVRCASRPEGTPVESFSLADKSGECPHITIEQNANCSRECEHDHQCQGSAKCCQNPCGGHTCTEPVVTKNHCESIFCGSHAKCHIQGETAHCRCEEGFGGDPNSMEGCTADLAEKSVKIEGLCTHKNSTYSPGDTFFDGCDFRCRCEFNSKVDCQDRCLFKISSFKSDPLCEIIEDPQDSCCRIMACETAPKQTIIPHEDTTSPPSTETTIINLEENPTTVMPAVAETLPETKPAEMEVKPTDVASKPSESENTDTNNGNNLIEAVTTSAQSEITTEMKPSVVEENLNEASPTKANIAIKPTEASAIASTETLPKTDDPNLQATDTQTTVKPTEVVETSTSTEAKPMTVDAVPPAASSESPKQIELEPKPTEAASVAPEIIASTIQTTKLVEPEVTTVSVDASSAIPSERGMRKDDVLIHEAIEKINSAEEEPTAKKAPSRLIGCQYNNSTYKTGEVFFDGCEARCVCDSPGLVSCVPRCSLVAAAPGDTCKDVVDPNDSCCRILICERPGDAHSVKNVEELKVIIEAAQPQNATTVKLRLLLMTADNTTAQTASTNTIQVWFASTTEGGDSSDTSWKKENFKLGDMQLVKPNVYEFDLNGLEPNTEYYFKVKKLSKATDNADNKGTETAVYSNTVNVKTFPKAVNAVVNGCFHRNKTYEMGEIFYDGCKFKCLCHEKGLIQCQDRCEEYVDNVGYEHCTWGPAPDDPCCTIPYCNEKPPKPAVQDAAAKNARCVLDGGKSYTLGETWDVGEGCTRKVCTCILRSNGTAMAECTGGCPPIPASAQLPSSDCPQPVLVTPDDTCLCPYILCNNAENPLSVPTPMCEYNSRRFHVGEEFYDGCRAVCQCGRDLKVNCAVVECPHHFPPHVSECLEWDVDPKFVPNPPNCCAPSKCKNDGSCLFNGLRLSNFQPIPQELLDCGTRCVCVNGNVTCENRCPKLTNTPPSTLPCPPSLAYRGHLPDDSCCLHWMCREQEESTSEYCEYNGRAYQPSEQWEVMKGSVRRSCTCRIRPNGRAEVDCTAGCPPIPDHVRLPSPQCPVPVLVTPDDPVMCPYVVCNNSLSGKGLQNISIMPLNTTAVRVRFTLPNLLIGLVGHAELHFTTDPSIPRDTWHVQKFARPRRLFDTANIEYHLSGLRPDTTYFFQIQLVIDALQGGPESEIYKLRLPAVVLTTTDLPPTTLPAMISIDTQLDVKTIDSNSVQVSWRPFDSNEKKFIDGIQIKYKKANKDDTQWLTSPMIHRDVTSYVLHDLEPSASYLVDVEFATPAEIPTHIVSAKHVELKTLTPPKSDYDFNVTLQQLKSSPYSTEFRLQGIPQPSSKYINVIRVTYKSDTDAEQTQVYKTMKGEKLSVDSLKPGRRYKLWVDLYLTNGKTISSSVLEVNTKAAQPGSRSLDEHVGANLAEALQSQPHVDDESKSYYIALIVVAVVAAVAALGFVVLLVILLRRQSSAKAPITRSPSESAYDNPTYKVSAQTYDGDKSNDVEKNGNGVQTREGTV